MPEPIDVAPRPVPIVDRWYCVRKDDDEWFPALWDEFLGWSNRDCWDDLRHEVRAWKLIPLPSELP